MNEWRKPCLRISGIHGQAVVMRRGDDCSLPASVMVRVDPENKARYVAGACWCELSLPAPPLKLVPSISAGEAAVNDTLCVCERTLKPHAGWAVGAEGQPHAALAGGMAAQQGAAKPAGAEALDEIKNAAAARAGLVGDLGRSRAVMQHEQGSCPAAQPVVRGGILAHQRGDEGLLIGKSGKGDHGEEGVKGLKGVHAGRRVLSCGWGMLGSESGVGLAAPHLPTDDEELPFPSMVCLVMARQGGVHALPPGQAKIQRPRAACCTKFQREGGSLRRSANETRFGSGRNSRGRTSSGALHDSVAMRMCS